MEKVKIRDIKTGAIKEVKKVLAGDFIGTGKFEYVKENISKNYEKPKTFANVNGEENK